MKIVHTVIKKNLNWESQFMCDFFVPNWKYPLSDQEIPIYVKCSDSIL